VVAEASSVLSGRLFAVDSVDFVMIESELVSRQTPVVRSKWSSPLSHSTQEMSRLAAVLVKKSTYFHRAAGSVLVGEASYSPKRRGTSGKVLRSRWKSDCTADLSLSEPQIVFPLFEVSKIIANMLGLYSYQALKMKSSRSQAVQSVQLSSTRHIIPVGIV
jgi:hypothetical protein